MKGFPRVDQLAVVVDEGVPIQATGEADVRVSLRYGNHSSIAPHHGMITSKICEDVRNGRAFIPKTGSPPESGITAGTIRSSGFPSQKYVLYTICRSLSGKSRPASTPTRTSSLPPRKTRPRTAAGHRGICI